MNPEALIMGVIESPLPVRDWLAISIFFLTWFAYARFAKFRAKRQHTLSSIMRAHREDWMRQVMLREQRVSDATILGNLERVVTFFCLYYDTPLGRHLNGNYVGGSFGGGHQFDAPGGCSIGAVHSSEAVLFGFDLRLRIFSVHMGRSAIHYVRYIAGRRSDHSW
jgi:hypothetical protein